MTGQTGGGDAAIFGADPLARPDWLLVAAITAVAATLRLVLLGRIPYGVHPDEAQLGTDAHKILAGDWIGVYTHAALGQPAGHSYLTTPSIWLLGDTAFALRLPLALVGIAAVPLLYLLVRLTIGRLEAVFAGALLTVSYWHLFYSRVAHWSISYGTVLLAALLCLALGVRNGRRGWFAASGLFLGLGVYTYNIYPVAVVTFVVYVALLVWTRGRGDAWPWWRRSLLTLGGVALTVALPMIIYLSNPNAYFWKHIGNYSEVGVTRSQEFRQADLAGKVRLIATQARTFAEAYTTDGKLDNVDGNGIRPVFDPLTLALLAAGAGMALVRRREPGVLLALLGVALIPLPAVLQRGSIMRQPLAAAPFAMTLAALPLAEAWRAAMRGRGLLRALPAIAAVALVAAIGVITIRDYFWTWRKDDWTRLIYYSQYTSASVYMRDLPRGTFVYFYDERASINLETRQFLAPKVDGIDRSREFSGFAGSIDRIARDRPVAFVLLGDYLPLLLEIEARYPGGTERIVKRDGKTEFYAYELPPEPAIAAP